MKPYYQQGKWAIYYGDCRDVLPSLPKASAVVTDPPYGLTSKHGARSPQFGEGGKKNYGESVGGFMGMRWDGTGVEVNKETWGIIRDSCLSGAPLLSFGGTRTFHRIAVAIEDAGWEIRDTVMWVYGSGFPKSLDISKAIDKHGGKQVGWFGKWLRKWRAKNAISQKEIAALFPSKTGSLTGCVANWELGFNMPTPEQFNLICQKFNLPFESIEQAEREIIARRNSLALPISDQLNGWGEKREYKITIPATPEAQLWNGYGTALKPAYEPIILAMNPLDGTFANNALKHGVAGLNIDECRIGTSTETHAKGSEAAKGHGIFGEYGEVKTELKPYGRFPANFIHDGSQMVMELFPQTTQIGYRRNPSTNKTTWFGAKDGSHIEGERGYGDNGSAARFFYIAKASRAEREYGLIGHLPCVKCGGINTETHIDDKGNRVNCIRNNHATVKPLSLVTYLVKLVKMPEYNLIIDPFMGSGTTLLACIRLGIPCIGIDNDEKSCEIAAKRCSQEVMELV